MAQSPRPPGPARVSGARGLLPPGTTGLQRVVGRMAGGRPTTLGLHCGKVGPESSLGRDRRSEGANQAGRGLHDTAPSGPGPDPGQRWPHLGGARGYGQALSGPWPLTRSVPLLLSLLPRLHLLDAPTAKPRRAYPERWVPGARTRASGRAHTLTQLRRP